MKYYSNDIRYFLFLSKIYVTPQQIEKCLAHVEDIKALFISKPALLKQCGLKPKAITAIEKPDWKMIDEELQQCEKENCYLIHFFNENYPKLLKEIPDPPLVIYLKGNPLLLNELQIAMVGTRNPTKQAYETAQQFAAFLAQKEIIITSGLALGIDTASHLGALTTGKTIAVMGTGVNTIYPSSNHKLAEKIIENGALISEFTLNEKPKAKNFPVRNRIISGMSVGTLVVEAALHSGSLITAKCAAEQNREVFAIPGSIHNPLARGCHFLLRQGAKLVETAEDILEELGPFLDEFFAKKPSANTSKDTDKIDKIQQHVLDQIGFETTPCDTIIARSGLTASQVSSILLYLEVLDLILATPGGYVRNTFKSERYV